MADWRQPEQDPITNEFGQELELETVIDPNTGQIAGYRETGNTRQNTAHFGAGGEAPALGLAPDGAPPVQQAPWPSHWNVTDAQADPAFTAALRRVQERQRMQREREAQMLSSATRAGGLPVDQVGALRTAGERELADLRRRRDYFDRRSNETERRRRGGTGGGGY
jgi:hypothetical protein